MTWCPRLLSMLIEAGKACLSRDSAFLPELRAKYDAEVSSGTASVDVNVGYGGEGELQVRSRGIEVSKNVLAPFQMLFSKDMLDARPVAPVSSFSRIFSKTSFANSFSWSFPSPDSMCVSDVERAGS